MDQKSLIIICLVVLTCVLLSCSQQTPSPKENNNDNVSNSQQSPSNGNPTTDRTSSNNPGNKEDDVNHTNNDNHRTSLPRSHSIVNEDGNNSKETSNKQNETNSTAIHNQQEQIQNPTSFDEINSKSKIDNVDLDKLTDNKSPEEVLIILKKFAQNGNDEAKLKLAIANFYGNTGFDMETAFKYFNELAEKGNGLASLYLGFMYAIGLPPAKANQAKALLYYTFAALSNHTYARMALGYRYWSGISVATNCHFALSYYRKVAKEVERSYTFSSSPSIQRIRIIDEADNPGSYPGTLDDDLIQYYQFLADKGDISAQVGLGQLHFQGARGVAQNQYRAFHYFTMASESGNTNAMAFLGKMYLEGNKVVEQSYEKALKYFKMSAEKENPIGQSGLGIMYLNGKGVNKDFKMALKYFSQAAMQGWVDGQLYLGIMYLNGYGVSKDYKAAIKYFTMALQSGHIIGFYHLAEMHASGIGTIQSCTTAVELFKSVCERGEWGTLMMEAHNDYKEGRRSNAFIKYAVLSELGYEVAQSNAAFMLDRNEVQDLFDKNEIYNRAFMYWSRSASQGYSIARVKLGDYHYYGLGTKVDYEMAANQYRIASEVQNNAQALFNLGYMYETGLGLKKDIYLAKRYYDLAAVTSTDAQVPVALALIKLFFIYFYDHIKNMDGWINIKNMINSPFEYLGEEWDLYFITVLVMILVSIIFFRRQIAP